LSRKLPENGSGENAPRLQHFSKWRTILPDLGNDQGMIKQWLRGGVMVLAATILEECRVFG
jgi:hypothetical protein